MLIGHQEQWRIVKGLAGANILPHAFLFSGQKEIGKTRFALEFAKFLQCEEKRFEARPCGVCGACKSIEIGAHPDVELVKADGKEISIAQIRKFGGNLFLKPAFDRMRVGIIKEADRMSAEAQNALLKTLEEPKGKVVLILASSKPEMFLQTVRSRVLQLKFSPVPQSELEKGLLLMGIQAPKLKKIAEFSFGKPGRAINFAKDDALLQKEMKIAKEFGALSRSSLALRFRYAKKITGEADNNLHGIIELWLRCLRNSALERISSDGNKSGSAKLSKTIRRLQDIDYILATTAASPRLAIETFFLEF